ncbi:MAG: YbaK/EbsC family protein [Chloroflexota bacterium]|nr:YbaK/EbsC family protein [Chloroflexota bacterium]
MQPLTPDDVQAALDRLDAGIQIRFFETTTATSQQAADAIGCELGQIVKSICFIVSATQPVVVLTSGDQRVDDRKIAVLYSVGRKQVRTATPDECITIWGYAPGGVPPLGYRTAGIAVYIDDSLKRYDLVYAAGGAHNAIFPLTLDQLVQATGGTITDVIRREAASDAGEGQV